MRSPLAEKNGRAGGPTKKKMASTKMKAVEKPLAPAEAAGAALGRAAAWREEEARLKGELARAQKQTLEARDRAGRTYELIDNLRGAHEHRLGVAQERTAALESAWEARERALSPEKRMFRNAISKAKAQRNAARSGLEAERAARAAADRLAANALRRVRDERVGIVETQRMLAEDAVSRARAAHAEEVAKVRFEAADYANRAAVLEDALADASEAGDAERAAAAAREAELWDVNQAMDEANVALENKYDEHVGTLQRMIDDQQRAIHALEKSEATWSVRARDLEDRLAERDRLRDDAPKPKKSSWPKLLLAAIPFAAAAAAAAILRPPAADTAKVVLAAAAPRRFAPS